MFFTNMELQPRKKKNTTCLKRMRLKLRTLLFAFMFPFFFVLQPWNTKAAKPTPSSPWIPMCHPSGIPIKIPFLFITKEPSEPPGCVKNGRLGKGYSSGRRWGDAICQFFSNSRWFRLMLWNDPIYTFWQEKWPNHPPRKYHVNIRVGQRKSLVQDVQVWMLKFKMISLFTQFPARTKTCTFPDEKWGFFQGNVLVPSCLFWWDFWHSHSLAKNDDHNLNCPKV